jgi:precorrin-6B methylase 2
MAAGRIVLNAVTLETVNGALLLLESKGFAVEMSQVSVARMNTVGDGRFMAALNPVFVISGER